MRAMTTFPPTTVTQLPTNNNANEATLWWKNRYANNNADEATLWHRTRGNVNLAEQAKLTAHAIGMHSAHTAMLPFHEPSDIVRYADAPGKKANQPSTTQIDFSSQIIVDQRFSSEQQERNGSMRGPSLTAAPTLAVGENRPPNDAVGDNELSATPQAILSQHCTATLQAQAPRF